MNDSSSRVSVIIVNVIIIVRGGDVNRADDTEVAMMFPERIKVVHTMR